MTHSDDIAYIKAQIAAYLAMKDELLTTSQGMYVVFRDGRLIDTYEDFAAAADDAVRRFGRGPYLIREVCEDDTATLPDGVPPPGAALKFH